MERKESDPGQRSAGRTRPLGEHGDVHTELRRARWRGGGARPAPEGGAEQHTVAQVSIATGAAERVAAV